MGCRRAVTGTLVSGARQRQFLGRGVHHGVQVGCRRDVGLGALTNATHLPAGFFSFGGRAPWGAGELSPGRWSRGAHQRHTFAGGVFLVRAGVHHVHN